MYLYKVGKKWYVRVNLPNGKRTNRTTGKTNRAEAEIVAATILKANAEVGRGEITEPRARKLIADILDAAGQGDVMTPAVTVEEYFRQWLESREQEVAVSTFAEYTKTVDLFLKYIDTLARRPLGVIKKKTVASWRRSIAAKLSNTSANKRLKILRIIFADAVRDEHIESNPAAAVKTLKTASQSSRRAFTMDELRRVFEVCSTPWGGLVLCALYTGQRLGDCASLKWSQVELDQRMIHFITAKTNKLLNLPLAPPLYDYLMDLPAVDKGSEYVFGEEIGTTKTNTLSHQFSRILADAGLVKKQTHKKTKQGRSGARQTGELSFHCLRHTATSLLKNAGVSDVIVREIIGHDSPEISRLYTHIEAETLVQALNRMPAVE